MIKREQKNAIKNLAKMFPVVSVCGPRQSGKSTLLKNVFSGYKYVTLEDKEIREFATYDPKNFLNQYGINLIIDEAQYAPDLFSYIQLKVDEINKPGMYILSGSQNFLLLKNISQSLAGRVGISHLLPFSLSELKKANINLNLNELLIKGFYPRIYDQGINPKQYYKNYIKTYLNKDINQILGVRNVAGFNRFLKFCAISVGQELNVNELSKKSGFSVQTVNSWLSVLQESYVIYLLQPYYNNIGKRLLKSPKLYFYDTGLLASLIGIKETEDFEKSDKKGFIFENFVISDIMKNYFNKNEEPELYYWRDSNQVEVDLIDDSGIDLKLVEIKSAKTANSNFAKSLNSVGNLLEVPDSNRFVIFQGENRVRVNNVTFDKWENITKF